MLPLEAKGKVALAGIQVFSTDKCSAPIFTAADTTGMLTTCEPFGLFLHLRLVICSYGMTSDWNVSVASMCCYSIRMQQSVGLHIYR